MVAVIGLRAIIKGNKSADIACVGKYGGTFGML